LTLPSHQKKKEEEEEEEERKKERKVNIESGEAIMDWGGWKRKEVLLLFMNFNRETKVNLVKCSNWQDLTP
jgi:hypothetical protein